eukprot:TRINITY_DN369_c0_g1_i1.p1 TRINITY_DN369_c0_g1~~TRINITY_DN369_c0_g1_i1.p1  ORF type:complete len:427 (-),score=76.78 TRINITY_DN369_c0_g1_i1:737-2017(-)
MAAMLALVLATLSLAAAVSADVCPPFANAKSSCTSTTCGHFVYKGKFSEGVNQFRLASAAEGIQLNAATSSPAACCNQCRQAEGCAYWSHHVKTGLCTLFSEGLCGGLSGGVENEEAYDPRELDSYVGGMCLAPKKVETVYAVEEEVKLLEEKSFCLVTDKSLHINMLLGGYYDSRTTGAKAVHKGMTVRTWIREMAVLWSAEGKVHTLLMSARRGADKERLDGYMESILVDGTAVPRLTLGDELNLFDGQAIVSFESFEKTGPYDVDVYRIRVTGLLEAEVRLRIAHPLLQLDSDAEVHMNVDILDLDFSEKVHGVLGQTYRVEKVDQALNYAVLSDLMYVTNAEESGSGSVQSMDGPAAKYLTTSVTSPDCAHAQFMTTRKEELAESVTKEVAAIAGAVEAAVSALPSEVSEVLEQLVKPVVPQ